MTSDSSLCFSQSLETALKYCNYFFSSTFVVEATLKLVAFGFRRFFKDRYALRSSSLDLWLLQRAVRMILSLRRWNQLDLAIVLLSVMGITLEEIEINASLPINPTIIRIMRVLRIARGELVNAFNYTFHTRGGNSKVIGKR